MSVSVNEFGASFKAFMDQMAAQGSADEPDFVRRLRLHFGAVPKTLPVVSERFEPYEHPNLHLALEDYLSKEGRTFEICGVTGDANRFMPVSLADLVAPSGAGLMARSGATEGPVEYLNIQLDNGRVLTCVQCGLYLISEGAKRLLVLLQSAAGFGPYKQLSIEVMASEKALAESFLGGLRIGIRQLSVYRGKILSVGQDAAGMLQITFHHLPSVRRDKIILPEGLLERIERQAIRFGQYGQKLLAAGRHLKRGILFHGSPGTGKTMTAMYLASASRERTVLLLTGTGLGLLGTACNLARTLQPSIVILEDVDLVAEERTHRVPSCSTPLLFELLNEMDGLADDADILFLLTTNRPDILEPALASRPGRIDQAFEVPLPDASCRKRLFELYGQGLQMQIANLDRFIDRTEGASAAFIRELLRKAALFAADEGDQIKVDDRYLDEALRELTMHGGEMTKSLLGFRSGGARRKELED